MKSRRPGTAPLRLAALILGAAVCFAAEPSATIPGYNQFTPEEEIRLGSALVSNFEAGNEVLANPLLDKYLSDLTIRLGKASRRTELNYTTKVLNSREVNALSFPGGGLYVTTGMLYYVQDESELASVLGHEIGHVVGRHVLNRLALSVKSQAVWDQTRKLLPVLDQKQVIESLQKFGLPVLNAATAQFDRSNESEADMFGIYDMLRAGWNPLGAVRALDRLKEPNQPASLLDALLRTHPYPADRSRAISSEIRNMALSPDLDENSLSFRAMKVGLDVLPKPRNGK